MHKNDRAARQVRGGASQFRASEQEGKKRISGYFAVFGETYEICPGVTESIDPHAFDGAIGEGADVRALIDHESRLVLGRTIPRTLMLRVDGKGLFGDIDVNERDTDATNLHARVERGDVNQCSFGFDILEEDMSIDDATGHVHYTIRAVRLYEVSVCTFPAYKQTGVSARAEMERQEKMREFIAWREKQKRRMKHGA